METMLDVSPKIQPTQPANPCRRFCYKLVTPRPFEIAILGVILFNTVCCRVQAYEPCREAGRPGIVRVPLSCCCSLSPSCYPSLHGCFRC